MYRERDLATVLDLAERHRAGDPSVKSFVCESCGNEFLTTSRRKLVRYCGSRCMQAHYRWRHQTAHICAAPDCSRWWIPARRRRWMKRFCSQACRLRTWRLRQRTGYLGAVPSTALVKDLPA